MRIIGGSHKGTRLATLGKGDLGAHLRPTSDRVRESLFNLLQNGGYGDPVSDALVLDLFAGTGALGFEALSRGAASVLFVEQGAVARGLIRQNSDLLRMGAKTRLLQRDATQLGAVKSDPFTLVFIDPPYGKGMGVRAMLGARAGGWIADEALVVLEESSPQLAPEGFALYDKRQYGNTWIHIFGPE